MSAKANENTGKVIVRMQGGLGNQLFIFAFTLVIAEKNQCKQIVLDLRGYKTYKVRDYELMNLIDEGNVRYYNKLKDFSLKYELSRTTYHLLHRLFKDDKKTLRYLSKWGLYYCNKGASEISVSKCKNNYIYGYFQDSSPIIKNDRLIRKSIIFSNNKECEIDKTSICVSMRLGDDYRNLGWPICSERYYKEAINYILIRKMYSEDTPVYVFADDFDRAKEMKISRNVIYMTDYKPAEQLYLMSLCSDYVMSNSSFSWWGAYLGKKTDSIIISPDLWYPDMKPTKETGLAYDQLTYIPI